MNDTFLLDAFGKAAAGNATFLLERRYRKQWRGFLTHDLVA